MVPSISKPNGATLIIGHGLNSDKSYRMQIQLAGQPDNVMTPSEDISADATRVWQRFQSDGWGIRGGDVDALHDIYTFHGSRSTREAIEDAFARGDAWLEDAYARGISNFDILEMAQDTFSVAMGRPSDTLHWNE